MTNKPTQEELRIDPVMDEMFRSESKTKNLILRSTQRKLLNFCEDQDEVRQLMVWLLKSGVPIRQMIVDIKTVNVRLAIQLCRYKDTDLFGSTAVSFRNVVFSATS
ncbi:hypothetical protein H6796_02300 [Candidatus Nomurabacteria bacterium]|nr:hypothetical protein [Candidatus Nomurabacteria bacterium]